MQVLGDYAEFSRGLGALKRYGRLPTHAKRSRAMGARIQQPGGHLMQRQPLKPRTPPLPGVMPQPSMMPAAMPGLNPKRQLPEAVKKRLPKPGIRKPKGPRSLANRPGMPGVKPPTARKPRIKKPKVVGG